MTKSELQEQALRLPPEERAELLEALQASLLDAPLPEWHREVLDERLADHERDPGAAIPWEDVKDSLRRRPAE
jgi:putative addiction module component (TIGR02574 family)